jgi:RNA polymerase sigma-70 factor (ECF subfamily)
MTHALNKLKMPAERARSLDQGEVVGRLRAGDPVALAQIIDLHGGAVHRVARSVLADAHVVEEVAQDVFLELWRRPDRFQSGRGSLRTYLVAVTRNKAIDRLRSHYARSRMTESVLEIAQRSPRQTADTQEEFATREMILAAIGMLPLEQRQALLLAYYGGRTYREVATELDVPEGTIKTRLRQALSALRRSLECDGEESLSSVA